MTCVFLLSYLFCLYSHFSCYRKLLKASYNMKKMWIDAIWIAKKYLTMVQIFSIVYIQGIVQYPMENHWANGRTMNDYIDNITSPYVHVHRNKVRDDSDLPLGQHALSILTAIHVQSTDFTTKLLLIVLYKYLSHPNCTDLLQHMDLSVNILNSRLGMRTGVRSSDWRSKGWYAYTNEATWRQMTEISYVITREQNPILWKIDQRSRDFFNFGIRLNALHVTCKTI
jgi:hypothetical protein